MTDAEIIKSIREAVKLSQAGFAIRIKTTQATVSSIESGRNPINYNVFKSVVIELGVNPWYFIQDGEPMFLPGKGELNALKKKIAAYEKLLDKMNDVKIKGS